MILAVIPARGGSKGIPRKNMVDVCGTPLVGWSILQAKQARQVTKIVVSSDSTAIGNYAIDQGVNWHIRSDEAAGDDSPTEDCIFEVLAVEQMQPDYVVLLQPTSPIRQFGLIDHAITSLKRARADSLFSARHIEGYVWRSRDDELHPQYEQREPRQRQRFQQWEENGSIYIFRPQVLRNHRQRLGGKIMLYPMSPLDSFQVDRGADLEMIRDLIKWRGAR